MVCFSVFWESMESRNWLQCTTEQLLRDTSVFIGTRISDSAVTFFSKSSRCTFVWLFIEYGTTSARLILIERLFCATSLIKCQKHIFLSKILRSTGPRVDLHPTLNILYVNLFILYVFSGTLSLNTLCCLSLWCDIGFLLFFTTSMFLIYLFTCQLLSTQKFRHNDVDD